MIMAITIKIVAGNFVVFIVTAWGQRENFAGVEMREMSLRNE